MRRSCLKCKSLEFSSGPTTRLYPRCTVRSIHRKLDGDRSGINPLGVQNVSTVPRSLTLAQNLKGVMSEALLSRFDIIFLMRTEDDPNQELVFEEL